jgi:hypothetical protein
MEFEEKRDLSPRREGTKEEGAWEPLTKGMTLGAGFAKSLRPKPAAALLGRSCMAAGHSAKRCWNHFYSF